MPSHVVNRRDLLATATAATALGSLASGAEAAHPLKLRYLLASCMYGYLPLGEIAAEVRQTGAEAIDIWPMVHGNQREQLAEMGEQAFVELLQQHQISLGCLTQYKLGPFGLREEMRLAERLNCHTMVTGGKGPVGLTGTELKAAVKSFCEQMKPHLAAAEEHGVSIAIENHANNLIDSPDSLKWLAEFASSEHLGVALAPYHLPQEEKLLADLIVTLGDRIHVFYAWQHGKGCMQKLPKEDELLQMPGRGQLDFEPLLSALRQIDYSGWTEVFMHPVPRGVPILETAAAVTEEIHRGRIYLERICSRLNAS